MLFRPAFLLVHSTLKAELHEPYAHRPAILRFIEDNWLGGKRISPIPFDNPPRPGTKRSYESGLSRAVSSDAMACASRSASARAPLPRGNQAKPAARTRARNTMAVARLKRMPSTKSLSAAARIAFFVAASRWWIGRPGPISAE